MRPEDFRVELEKQERKAFNDFLQLFGDTCIAEKIKLMAEEADKGLVLRLKTEWASPGIPHDGFAHPEIQIDFSAEQCNPRLLYKDKDLSVPDLYQACASLVGELSAREQDSHKQMLFGHAEHALGKYFQRGRIKSYFFKVYPLCANFDRSLPTFEALELADLLRIRQLLIAREQKFETKGHICCLNGVGFFKNIQWEDKRNREHAFDPVDFYETGEPDTAQFREDLERYAKLADKSA